MPSKRKNGAKFPERAQNGRHTPSVLTLIYREDNALRSFAMGLTFLILGTVGFLSPKEPHEFFQKVFPWVIVFGFGNAYRIVAPMKRTFENGEEVAGRVIAKGWRLQSRYLLEYSYSFQGRGFVRHFATNSSKKLKKLVKDSEITVVVDPARPEQGLVKELFE